MIILKNMFYFTDIHGMYYLYDSIINDCLEVDPTCTIVFGGDAADRGPAGYRIMRELLDNPQVVYLKGNHEQLFVNAAHEIIGFCAADDNIYNKLKSKDKDFAQNLCISCDEIILPNLYLHLINGGARTIQDWIVDGADEDFVDKIEALPLTFSYENIDFCHAGSTYNDFKVVADAEYEHRFLWQDQKDAMLWDRKNIALGWATDRIGVFGHTPSTLLPTGIYGHDKSGSSAHPCAWQDKMGAIDKRGGWKIDMDTGAVWTNRAYVLNCLTMQVTGYEDDGDGEGNHTIKIIDQYKIIQ